MNPLSARLKKKNVRKGNECFLFPDFEGVQLHQSLYPLTFNLCPLKDAPLLTVGFSGSRGSLFDTLIPPLLYPCSAPRSLLTLRHIRDAYVSPGGLVHQLLVSHYVAETEVECRRPTG